MRPASVTSITPVVCMPWHLRGSEDEPVQGATCRYCSREVAVPVSQAQRIAACIYCGLDRGLVPAEEVVPY